MTVDLENYKPIEVYESYVDQVLDGSIAACNSVIGSCRRHRRDLRRQRTEEFPYYFDEDHAEALCLWFPTFIKHSIGKYLGQPFVLQPWQCLALASIFGWKKVEDDCRRFRSAYISVARKNGKAQSLSSWIPTPKGLVRMRDIHPGMEVIGRYGEPVKVVAETEVFHDRRCLEVEFNTGEKIVCDENHEWVVNIKRRRNYGKEVWFSEEIFEAKDLEGEGHGYKYRVPTVVLRGRKRKLPIDPYVFGCWLGDGWTDGGGYTCDPKDWPDCKPLFEQHYKTTDRKCKKNHGILGLVKDLRAAGVLGDKHIPEEYFLASYDQRLELLRGLMDTDGHCSKSGQCEFVQKSAKLTRGVHRLLCSLGINAEIKAKEAKCNGKDAGVVFRILFYPPTGVKVFNLERKSNRQKAKKKDGTRKIVAVRETKSVPTKCIQVEGGVYCTSSSYILTHNSTFAGAVCHFAAGFDRNPITQGFESVAQVILAASKKEQAERVTMAECIRMRAKSEAISSMSNYRNRQITYDHNGGHIFTAGSDKAFDGLNPSMINIDELHAFRSTGQQMEFINTMKTGSGSRSQPLFLVTTTAGSTSSEVWKSEWEYATAVATGEVIDESYFCLSYELDEEDDPLDEDNWIKANPCLGVTLSLEYLRDQAKPAAIDKVALNRFTRYHGNRLVSSLDAAFDLKQWDECEGVLSDWSDADCVGAGVDLGSRDDLAAFALVARFDTGECEKDDTGFEAPVYRYEARVWAYLAKDTVRDVTTRPFSQFIEDGLLNFSKFPLSDLETDLVEACAAEGCYSVAFDPYQAQATGERLENEGLEPATMSQTTRCFNEPIGELRAAIADGRFTHDGNPLLRWCVGNAVIVSDRNDRIMYAKADSKDKIDPVVAMTMALQRAMTLPGRSDGFFTVA